VEDDDGLVMAFGVGDRSFGNVPVFLKYPDLMEEP